MASKKIKGYQVEFGKYGNNLSSLVKDKIDALDLPGLEFEEIITRNYRYGDFACGIGVWTAAGFLCDLCV